MVKHKVYGLDKFYTNFDPGSGGALDAAIAGGFKKGKPVFTYYWTPTGLMGKVDLVQLKEPAYDNACWTKMMAVVEDIKANGPDSYKDTCASAYVDMSLTKSATTKFANDPANKPIIDFVKKYSVPTAEVNKALGFYMTADGDLEATAKDFLQGSSAWTKWVPADVAAKVKASL
jgi:glycine betaine/proline transport system substrate-binding protein